MIKNAEDLMIGDVVISSQKIRFLHLTSDGIGATCHNDVTLSPEVVNQSVLGIVDTTLTTDTISPTTIIPSPITPSPVPVSLPPTSFSAFPFKVGDAISVTHTILSITHMGHTISVTYDDGSQEEFQPSSGVDVG